MEMRKFLVSIISAIILLQIFSLSISALDKVSFEQVLPIIPRLNAVVKISGQSNEILKKSDFYATFGNKKLKVMELEKYNVNNHNTVSYFIVDCSSSINNSYLSEVKSKLINYSNNLSRNEKMVLVAFGAEIKTVLSGNEDVNTRASKINSLSANQSQTDLYDAVRYTIEKSQNDVNENTDRSFAVLITDGENYDNDGGNTKQEIIDLVSGHGLPIYSLCLCATNDNASDVGSLSRQSGGEIHTVKSLSEVSAAFDKIIKSMRNVFILTLRTQENIEYAGNSLPLQLRVKNKSATVECKPSRWIKDDSAPKITDVEFKVEEDGSANLYIYYSENVINADKKDNFIIERNGQKIDVSKVKYVMTDDEYYSVITLKREPVKGKYDIRLDNITDSSNEHNAIKYENKQYNIGDNNGFVLFFVYYWYIVLIVLVLIFIFVTVLLLYKKRQEKDALIAEQIVNHSNQYMHNEVEVHEKYHHHIVTPRGILVDLVVESANDTVRTVKTHVGKHIVVGRSEKCDVYLDDPKMSRTHFRILEIDNKLWIEDLQSANGTKVNGSKIGGRTLLRSGDKIQAGQTKIFIRF